MINKGEVQFGDIFFINCEPSSGHEFNGNHPAVVIQSNSKLKKSNLVTILPLTSNLKNKMIDDIIIKVDPLNNLKYDSVIKVYCPSSFDYVRFIKKIGVVDQNTLNKIKKYLKTHFDI